MERIIKDLNDTSKNYVYSPMAIYYALLLLVQTTAGDTKQEILDVLETKESELIQDGKLIRKALDIKEDTNKIILNSSLWLSNRFNFNVQNIKDIVRLNECEINIGKMGSKEFDEQIHDWINSNTNNLLKDSVCKIKTEPFTLLELFSTLYIKGNWIKQFNRRNTTKDKFVLKNDEKVDCKYMNNYIEGNVLFGKRFKAFVMRMSLVGDMIFILPYEGLLPEDIKNDHDLLELLQGNINALLSKNYLVDFSLPKFDVMCDLDLKSSLESLGIIKAFDYKEADFTPLSYEKELCITKANHTSRLKVDENGLEAAAYVEMAIGFGGMFHETPELIQFKLNRPFMFSVVKNSYPLFIGTLMNPNS